MLLFLAVALVSAGALAYEVLLTRLFSIVQWHHYAYMVISIALLGYGASGAFLALVGDGLRRHLGAAFAAGAALFAVSAVTSFAVAERLPFNALAVICLRCRSSARPPASGLHSPHSRSGSVESTATT